MTVRDYSTTANDNTTIEGIALADTMLANIPTSSELSGYVVPILYTDMQPFMFNRS